MDAATLLAPLTKANGFLSLVYKDLAQPGVQQVGKAVGSIIGLGNTILIPLRMLNETGRLAEEAAFARLAERFSSIPSDSVHAVPPEVGVPALENLSRTADTTLQDLYVELLATAAQESDQSKAHPSFVSVISALSPDEAKLLPQLRGSREYAFITVKYKDLGSINKRTVKDLVFGSRFDIHFHDNVPLYISNLAGLGVIEISRSTYLSDNNVYENLFVEEKKSISFPDNVKMDNREWRLVYDKGLISVTEYGQRLIEACVPA